MDDVQEIHVPSRKASMAIPRAQERELAYRILAAHLRRGVSMKAAIETIRLELGVNDEDSRDSDHTERERVIAAVALLGKSHAKLAKDADKPFSRVLSEEGVKLTLVERGILSIPCGAIAGDQDLGALLEATFDAMERARA